MLTLIKNELKKIMLKRKTLVISIGFIALIGLICFGLYKDSENNRSANKPERRQQQLQTQIDDLKRRQNSSELNQAGKEDIADSIVRTEQELKILKEKNNGTEDWKKTLKNSMALSEYRLKSNIDEAEKEDIRINLKEDQYRLDHNVKPVESYDLSAYKYFDESMEILGAIFLIIGLLVFAADMVSGEYTPPTMKLLLTQPVSRAKVLLSKYLASIVSAILLILSIEAVSFIVMGLIFGFGNPLDPITIGAKYKFDAISDAIKIIPNSSHIVPAWQYTLMNVGMETLYIIACISFAFLVSTVLNSSMISVVTGVVTAIVTIVIGSIPFMSKIIPYIFIYHGNSKGILRGSMANQYSNPHITISNSIIAMVVWTVVCYGISHIIFTKRDMLI